MEASPLLRFYGFLGFTGFLAVAGTACGVRWNEDKGARTFLALATWFVPVATVQWAGFLHAELSRPVPPHEIFHTEAVGATSLFFAGAAWLVTALPTVFLAFAAMARPVAGRLTLAYLAGNVALAQPERDPVVVLAIAAGLLALLLAADWVWFSREARLKHWDGAVTRLTLFLPLGILLGRNLVLYGEDASLAGFAFGAMGAGLFLGLPSALPHEGWRTVSRWIGAGSLTLGWCLFADRFREAFGWSGSEGVIPLMVLPCAGLTFLGSLLAGREGRIHRSVSAGVAMAMLFVDVGIHDGSWPILAGLVLGVALVAAAFWLSERFLLIIGVLGFGGSLAHVVLSLREFWAQNLWVSLGALGVGILVASSLVERNWRRLHQSAALIRKGWEAWD
jgi:hypothetical protein